MWGYRLIPQVSDIDQNQYHDFYYEPFAALRICSIQREMTRGFYFVYGTGGDPDPAQPTISGLVAFALLSPKRIPSCPKVSRAYQPSCARLSRVLVAHVKDGPKRYSGWVSHGEEGD